MFNKSKILCFVCAHILLMVVDSQYIGNNPGIITNSGLMGNVGRILPNGIITNQGPILANPSVVTGNPVKAVVLGSQAVPNNGKPLGNTPNAAGNTEISVSDLAGGQASLPSFNCGNFVVSCTSPLPATGVSVIADNLVIDGALAVSGNMPIFSAVALEGALPASGQGTVLYVSNGNTDENEGLPSSSNVFGNEGLSIGAGQTFSNLGNFAIPGGLALGRS